MQKHDFVIQNQINQHWVLFPSHWATILIQQKITRHRCCLKPNQDLLALVLRPRKVSVPHSKMSNLMLATKLLYSHILKQTGFPSYKKFQVYTPLFLHTNFPGLVINWLLTTLQQIFLVLFRVVTVSNILCSLSCSGTRKWQAKFARKNCLGCNGAFSYLSFQLSTGFIKYSC